MQQGRLKKGLIVFLKIILILWGVLWAVGNLASIVIPYEEVIQESSTILNTDATTISTTAFEATKSPIEQIFKLSFRPFLVLSSVSIILGIIILYNGRTFIEMLYMFNFFMIPRKRRYWGSILDSVTQGKISLASISLLKVEDGKEKIVSRTVSDLDGNYRIRIPEAGKYNLEVKAEGYETFRKEITSRSNEEEYLDNVTITRLNQTKQSFLGSYYKLKSVLYTPLIIYLFVFCTISFVLYVNQSIIKPGLDTYAGALIFGIAFVWNIFTVTERIRNKGGVIKDETSHPVRGVTIRLFKDDKQLDSKISDDNGVVKFEVNSGMYKILISKEGYVLPNHKENEFIEVKINNDGYLANNIVLHSTGKANNSELLVNPFEK